MNPRMPRQFQLEGHAREAPCLERAGDRVMNSAGKAPVDG